MRHITPPELINPAPEPTLLAYLWEMFLSLNNTRQSGMSAMSISHLEILAFCQLRNIRLSVFELNAISRLDRIALTQKG